MRQLILATLVLGPLAVGCAETVVHRSARASDPETRWQAKVDRGTRFHRSGLYDQALDQYAAALEIARGFPSGDRRVIETLSRRVELYLVLRDYDEAEADYQQIIREERRMAAPNDGLANALNRYATFCIDLDRADDAIVLLGEAIQIRRALYGDRHPNTALLIQNVGDAFRRVGDYAQAEQYLVLALSIYASADPGFYDEAAIAQNLLALVFGSTGRETDAERLHLDAIRLSVKALGDRNADMAVFTRDLADLYTRQARYVEADELYKGVMAIFRETLGPSSYQMSKTYRAYATMLDAAGRTGEAADYRARAQAAGF